jgi:hypothetical protein
MVPADEQHVARLRREYTRRLRALELRLARQGESNVDPAVLAEIEDIQQRLAEIGLLEQPRPSAEIKAAIRAHFDDDLDFLIAQFSKFGQRLTGVEEQVSRVMQAHNAAQEWRLGITDDVQQLKGDPEKERRSRAWGRGIQVLILALVIAVLVILLYWLW